MSPQTAHSEDVRSILGNPEHEWDIVEDSNSDGDLPLRNEVEDFSEDTAVGKLYPQAPVFTEEICNIIGHPLADQNSHSDKSHCGFDFEVLDKLDEEQSSIEDAEKTPISATWWTPAMTSTRHRPR